MMGTFPNFTGDANIIVKYYPMNMREPLLFTLESCVGMYGRLSIYIFFSFFSFPLVATQTDRTASIQSPSHLDNVFS